MTITTEAHPRALLAEARRALGIEQLVLSIHDASFPSQSDEATGRGTPYSRGARALLLWAMDQGFTGIQFGPQGETSRVNPSPYDGTAFARTVLSVALWPLAHDPAWEGILDPRTLESIVAGAPAARDGNGSLRADYPYVYDAQRRALREARARMRPDGALARRFARFRRDHAAWLDRDARMEALTARFGTDDWRAWPPGPRDVEADDPEAEFFAFGQFVAHVQHEELLRFAESEGLALFGDLHIGLSFRDCFEREGLFVRDYRMGAPPSRTNPDGQPWGYPVFEPDSEEALALFRARVEKLLTEFHGIRIDHPHGLVCPWVYAADAPNPVEAVNRGARFLESPDLPDHPGLARRAVARADQLDRAVPRYADGWVRSLDEAQIDRYCQKFAVVIDAARARGRATDNVLCEVLSTCPYPLARVLERYGLGRFRVTQKADPRVPEDTYRSDRAQRADWIMLGNHDTPPIRRALRAFPAQGKIAPWCDYLEARLGAGAIDRDAVAADPTALARPMFADLFVGSAAHVSVFFEDLMGGERIYNAPGTASGDNWSLRIGNDFLAVYRARLRTGEALSVPRAMAAALRARGARAGTPPHAALAARLDALADLPAEGA